MSSQHDWNSCTESAWSEMHRESMILRLNMQGDRATTNQNRQVYDTNEERAHENQQRMANIWSSCPGWRLHPIRMSQRQPAAARPLTLHHVGAVQAVDAVHTHHTRL